MYCHRFCNKNQCHVKEIGADDCDNCYQINAGFEEFTDCQFFSWKKECPQMKPIENAFVRYLKIKFEDAANKKFEIITNNLKFTKDKLIVDVNGGNIEVYLKDISSKIEIELVKPQPITTIAEYMKAEGMIE